MDLLGLLQPEAPTTQRKRVSDQEYVGMGWSSDALAGISEDGLWEALTYKARKPAEFMDVSNVTVEDRRGFLWRKMTVRASNKTVVEHIYANERKGEMVYRVVDPATRRESEDERVVAIRSNPLRLEFYHRHTSDGYRSYWHAPTKVVAELVEGLAKLAKKLEGSGGTKVGLGMRSRAIQGVSFDAVWKSMIECVRDPAKYMAVRLESIRDCQGFIQRVTSISGKKSTDNVYIDERSHEIVYRPVNGGTEGQVERVVALRSHPLCIEFHARDVRDGFRIDWTVPRKVVGGCIKAYTREAKIMDSATPKTIGYGITSDPVKDCSFDSLMTAIQKTVMDPSLVLDIVPSKTTIREERGFILRRFTLRATNEVVMEKVTINEAAGEVVFNKLTGDAKESANNRVIAIQKDPLRLEFYERNARDGARLNWTAPYEIASAAMTGLIMSAKQIEKVGGAVIGYGISSGPITGILQENLWKAMLFCVRNPAKSGMNVENVKIFDNDGYMTRFMSIPDAKGKPMMIDNIYTDEQSATISYRRLELQRGGEGLNEKLFAIRQAPLRMEMWCRHTKDQLRVDWQAPKQVALEVFGKVAKLADMIQNDPRGFDRSYGAGLDESKGQAAF